MAKEISELEWDIEVTLCDPREEVISSWNRFFGEKRPEVKIVQGSIFDQPGDALLLPGNSFGFFDAGLALEVLEKWGWDLQDLTRNELKESYFGELLVGQAIVIEATADRPAVIYTPVVRTKSLAEAGLPVYLASRGALRAAKKYNDQNPDKKIKSITIPSMACQKGELDPLISARQIRFGYEQAVGLRGAGGKNLSQLHRRAQKIEALPKAIPEEENE